MVDGALSSQLSALGGDLIWTREIRCHSFGAAYLVVAVGDEHAVDSEGGVPLEVAVDAGNHRQGEGHLQGSLEVFLVEGGGGRIVGLPRGQRYGVSVSGWWCVWGGRCWSGLMGRRRLLAVMRCVQSTQHHAAYWEGHKM